MALDSETQRRKGAEQAPTPGKTAHASTGPKIVMVTNQKGGVGKTTIVLALAHAAHAAGQPAVVIDTDPQGSATQWSLTRAKLAIRPIDDVVVRSMAANNDIVENGIGQAIKDGAEWIFIDTAPSLNGATLDLMQLADVVIVPISDSVFDFQAVRRTFDTVCAAGRSPIVVFNRVPPNARKALGELVENLKKVRKDVSIAPALSQRAEVKSSQMAYQAVGEKHPRSRATAETKALLDYVTECFGGEIVANG